MPVSTIILTIVTYWALLSVRMVLLVLAWITNMVSFLHSRPLGVYPMRISSRTQKRWLMIWKSVWATVRWVTRKSVIMRLWHVMRINAFLLARIWRRSLRWKVWQIRIYAGRNPDNLMRVSIWVSLMGVSSLWRIIIIRLRLIYCMSYNCLLTRDMRKLWQIWVRSVIKVLRWAWIHAISKAVISYGLPLGIIRWTDRWYWI